MSEPPAVSPARVPGAASGAAPAASGAASGAPGAADFSRSEMMIVAAARELADQRVCFVGVGLPNIAV
ncbi:MAG TPA: hypothetical protein VGE81_08945, partial [Candidatus Limnocylindrales bacterium]